MRISDYQRGLKALGPFRVTQQLHKIIVKRAKEENRTQTNYIINLIIRDAIDHGYEVEDDPALNMNSRRPAITGTYH